MYDESQLINLYGIPLILPAADVSISFLDCCEEVWGRWTEGLQGGYIYDRDFDLNPQIDISVPEGGELKFVFILCLSSVSK